MCTSYRVFSLNFEGGKFSPFLRDNFNCRAGLAQWRGLAQTLQYQEKHCIPKTPTSTIVITSSRSPLSTLINAAEPCSLPKGCLPFYFYHRRNVIKLKLVSLEQQVYLHTVLSSSGSKLTDRPSYLNHTCRILQPKILFPNFMHNFIIIIHIILSTL